MTSPLEEIERESRERIQPRLEIDQELHAVNVRPAVAVEKYPRADSTQMLLLRNTELSLFSPQALQTLLIVASALSADPNPSRFTHCSTRPL